MSQSENIHEGQSPKTSCKPNRDAKQKHLLRTVITIIVALGMIAAGVYLMLGCQSAPKQTTTTATDESKPQDDVEAVDMGLSVRWATSNVGAQQAEDDGDYYAWGEVTPSTSYVWRNSLTYGKVVDAEVLPTAMDASATLGDGWRMPTVKEFEELVTKCEWHYRERNGRLGYEVTAPNGNAIFLPASGYIYDTICSHRDIEGLYWCSNTNTEDDDKHATVLKLSNRDKIFESLYRYYGAQIRAVRE